jgi:hypothetical protein
MTAEEIEFYSKRAIEESLQWETSRHDDVLLQRLAAAHMYIRAEYLVPRDGACLYHAIADQLVLNCMLIGGDIEASFGSRQRDTPIGRGEWEGNTMLRAAA